MTAKLDLTRAFSEHNVTSKTVAERIGLPHRPSVATSTAPPASATSTALRKPSTMMFATYFIPSLKTMSPSTCLKVLFRVSLTTYHSPKPSSHTPTVVKRSSPHFHHFPNQKFIKLFIKCPNNNQIYRSRKRYGWPLPFFRRM